MLPTPSTFHVNTDRVYEPAEDSFLLLDTLSSPSEVGFLKKRFLRGATDSQVSHSPVILEVGTGSGVVLAFLTANAYKIFGRADVLSLGTDINPFACQATEQTVLQACRDESRDFKDKKDIKERYSNQHPLAILNADLTTPIRSGMVDVLIFNPPYVPTSEVPLPATADTGSSAFQYDSRLLALSYAGGVHGMEVTNKLLEQIPRVLSPERGLAYILLCEQNKPKEVMQRIRQWGPAWAVTLVGDSGKTGGWEKLRIIRISVV
ncbi:S-adenosylmethionine-dependent methyltransferase [Peltigera leucophlebia]|nr:S-adenosylmethionine-dependent methyltransferase [Peltigera leucophlebia]